MMKLVGRHVLFGTPPETDEEIQRTLDKMEEEERKWKKEMREAAMEDREEKPNRRRKIKPTKGARSFNIE